jgi:hypothetical protein
LKLYYIHIILLFFVFKSSSFAQNTDSVKIKKSIVKLKAGKVLYADDRYVVAKRDTIVELPINVDYYISSNKSGDKIYLELQQKAYKNRWTRELHNIILIPEDSSANHEEVKTEKGELPFLPFYNLPIRKITLNKLNVFGPSISKPNNKSRTVFGKYANNIHVVTRDGVIIDHLLFKQGEAVDPYVMADNERLLRALPYIEDAKIIVYKTVSDSVDVEVITKDNFSLGFDVDLSKNPSIKGSIWDNNIFGSGQEFDNYFYRTPDKKPRAGIDGIYKIRNIGGSFINCQIGYRA